MPRSGIVFTEANYKYYLTYNGVDIFEHIINDLITYDRILDVTTVFNAPGDTATYVRFFSAPGVYKKTYDFETFTTTGIIRPPALNDAVHPVYAKSSFNNRIVCTTTPNSGTPNTYYYSDNNGLSWSNLGNSTTLSGRDIYYSDRYFYTINGNNYLSFSDTATTITNPITALGSVGAYYCNQFVNSGPAILITSTLGGYLYVVDSMSNGTLSISYVPVSGYGLSGDCIVTRGAGYWYVIGSNASGAGGSVVLRSNDLVNFTPMTSLSQQAGLTYYGAYFLGERFIVVGYQSNTPEFLRLSHSDNYGSSWVNTDYPYADYSYIGGSAAFLQTLPSGTQYRFGGAISVVNATVNKVSTHDFQGVLNSITSTLVSGVKNVYSSVISNSIGTSQIIGNFKRLFTTVSVTDAVTLNNRFLGKILQTMSTSVSSFFGYDTTFRKNLLAVSHSISSIPKSKFWTQAWSILYNGLKWIGVKNATSLAVTSVDGGSWSEHTLPSNNAWGSIATDNTTTIAISKLNGKVAVTTDGISWIEKPLPTAAVWSSLSYGGGKFVAVAIQNDTAAVSADSGVTWTNYPMSSYRDWTSVAFNGTVFCAVSYGGKAATSPDGITWTEHDMPDAINYSSIAWVTDRFVAVATGPTNLAASSTDGVTWTRITMPSSQNWTAVGPGVGNPDA